MYLNKMHGLNLYILRNIVVQISIRNLTGSNRANPSAILLIHLFQTIGMWVRKYPKLNHINKSVKQKQKNNGTQIKTDTNADAPNNKQIENISTI